MRQHMLSIFCYCVIYLVSYCDSKVLVLGYGMWCRLQLLLLPLQTLLKLLLVSLLCVLLQPNVSTYSATFVYASVGSNALCLFCVSSHSLR